MLYTPLASLRSRRPLSSNRWPHALAASGLPIAAGLLTALVALSPAGADMVPEPPQECVGKPDGTFCSLGDGTAGQCVTVKDARRPGRSYQSCRKDAHECDRLAIGAVCHGYLGKPSHCREFRNPERGETWRTCQADETPAAANPTAPTDPAATAGAPTAPPTSAPPTSTPTTAIPAPEKKGLFGCQLAVGGAAPNVGGGSLGLLGVVAAWLLQRRRRQKTLG